MSPMTRREVFKGTSGLIAAAAAMADLSPAQGAQASGRKLHVVVVGAHPDDPESGCGGTMARFADLGHTVTALYLTRGEAGIDGKSHDEAAKIRTAEAEAACKILGAKATFAGQVDADTEISPRRYDKFRKVLLEEKPDVVFAHWPIDDHRDHRVASLLVYDAWKRSGRAFSLYYFEVMSGIQTQHFHPTDYVDIAATAPRKREAVMCHASQHPAASWFGHHETMDRFRGGEYHCKLAEAFVRHAQSILCDLPK